MKMNKFRLLLLLVISTFSGCSITNNDDDEKKPNILLILADDLGWSDLGCYGGEINTPNLDKLAQEGIRFTQFHNTSKCFPSRACLLTGMYAQQCGYDKTYKDPIKNALTLGEVLKSAGYRTLWSGKHHGIENPVTRGFDRYYGLRDGACNHFNPGKQKPGEGKPAQKRPDRAWCIDDTLFQPYTPLQKDFYTTDYFTKYALNWLDEYKDEDKPFFLYLAYTAPHDPLMAWPEDIQKYKGKYLAGYDEIRQGRFTKQKEMGLLTGEYKLSDATYEYWDSLSEKQKLEEDLKMAVYAAMVDRMDQNIGKILNKIEELGKTENTLIMFMSDNGCSAEVVNIPGSGKIGTITRWTSLGKNWANVSNTPFRYYKNYSHEGGICTPMIACWPKGIVSKNRISDFCGHFIDIMATFIDITEFEYPESYKGQDVLPYEGQSILPIFKGGKMERRKPLFWEWSNGKAARKERWKIVSWGENSPWCLYDMDNDPTETTDMANKFPEIVVELDSLFNNWIKTTNNTMHNINQK